MPTSPSPPCRSPFRARASSKTWRKRHELFGGSGRYPAGHPLHRTFRSRTVNWGWYQEGYDLEATDPVGVASHSSYVTHHNGAQYFGYISDTPAVSAGMHGLTDFFDAMANNSLPAGGVFYIRGGYKNLTGKKPVITDPKTPADEVAAIDAAKGGRRRPSGLLRQTVERSHGGPRNQRGRPPTPIWSRCAIIITYDETDGSGTTSRRASFPTVQAGFFPAARAFRSSSSRPLRGLTSSPTSKAITTRS